MTFSPALSLSYTTLTRPTHATRDAWQGYKPRGSELFSSIAVRLEAQEPFRVVSIRLIAKELGAHLSDDSFHHIWHCMSAEYTFNLRYLVFSRLLHARTVAYQLCCLCRRCIPRRNHAAASPLVVGGGSELQVYGFGQAGAREHA